MFPGIGCKVHSQHLICCNACKNYPRSQASPVFGLRCAFSIVHGSGRVIKHCCSLRVLVKRLCKQHCYFYSHLHKTHSFSSSRPKASCTASIPQMRATVLWSKCLVCKLRKTRYIRTAGLHTRVWAEGYTMQLSCRFHSLTLTSIIN